MNREAVLDFETPNDYEESDTIEVVEQSDIEKQLQEALSYEEPVLETVSNEATLPETPTQETPETTTEQSPQYDKAELDKFQEMFKNVFGLDPEVVKSQLQEQQVKTAQEKLSNDLNTLQTEWQIDRTELNTRLDLVSQHLASMSPEMQRSLDNPEGIRLIWRSISGDASRKVPPRFERNTTQPTRSKPQITWAQIEAMDNATYERNIDTIQALISKGLLKNN